MSSGQTTAVVDIRRLRELIEAAAAMEVEESEEDGMDDGTGNNLVLVMNLNVRVVLCDCGQAYKLPVVDGLHPPVQQQQQLSLDKSGKLLPFHKKTLLAVKKKLKERF